jgi:hypothetical protein
VTVEPILEKLRSLLGKVAAAFSAELVSANPCMVVHVVVRRRLRSCVEVGVAVGIMRRRRWIPRVRTVSVVGLMWSVLGVNWRSWWGI